MHLARTLFIPLLSLCTVHLALSQIAADSIFKYDRGSAMNVTEYGHDTRSDALVRDITFTAVDNPVKAYLVTPATGTGPHAAILYVHWLGEPATTNRTEFLDEAVKLAGCGVISLLVDTMWAQPQWYKNRVPEQDYDRAVHQVIELRRAMDLLLEQPGVDAQRVAFVGHDFGAMYGLIAIALDQRVKTCVLMSGTPNFIDWFLFAAQPKDPESYKKQIATLDPMLFVPRLAPVPIFFQFASKDHYVSADRAAAFYAAALPPKYMATYDAGHDLHTTEVANDRVAWLVHQLGLK